MSKFSPAVLAACLITSPLLAENATLPRRGQVTIEMAAPSAAPELPKMVLPPLPEGVVDLKFGDIFRSPVGSRGLELTDKVRALDGKKVRFLGYMVREHIDKCGLCVPASATSAKLPDWVGCVIPGRLLLTPEPVQINQLHYGLCDDLPAQTVFVKVPDQFGELIPYTPGLLLLTGTLSLGNHTEPDGRISVIRLTLDPQSPADTQSATTLTTAFASPEKAVLSAQNPTQKTP